MPSCMTTTTSRQPAPSITRTIGLWASRLLVAGWLIGGGASLSLAQDTPATELPQAADEVAQPIADQPLITAEQEKKRQVTLAGFLIVSLVSVLGVLLVLLAIWWAQRLRRINDTQLPKQHLGDPLWYLRKGSAETSSTPTTDTEKSDETTHG